MMCPSTSWFPLLVLLAASLTSNSPIFSADWTQYLGPDRTGTVPGAISPQAWPADALPKVRWQTRAGNGIAAPLVVGGVLYTMGALRPEADPSDGVGLDEMWGAEDLAKGLDPGSPHDQDFQALVGKAGMSSPDKFRYLPVVTHAFAFDAATGALRWAAPIGSREWIYQGEGMNIPRAAPLWSDGRLYFQTHAGSIACLSAADGTALWKTTIADLGSQRSYIFGKCGVGGAPFTDGTRVFFTFPHDNNQSTIAAFEPASGKVLWKTTVNTGFRVDLLSASLAPIEGQPTIVVPGGYKTHGLDPATGAVRWTFNAHEVWPEISFDKSKHSATNSVYWEDQHPGRIPVIYGDFIVNRIFIWGGHKDQRTYCITIEGGKPRVVWDTKTLSCWRGLYIRKDHLLLAMDYGHATPDRPPKSNLTREQQVYDAPRYQCIDIPTGKRLWGTDAFTSPDDPGQLTYGHFEPEHLVVGDQVVVMHMNKLGYGRFDEKGITIQSVDSSRSYWGFSPLVYHEGRLFFQRMATQNKLKNSFGDQEYNLFCLALQ